MLIRRRASGGDAWTPPAADSSDWFFAFVFPRVRSVFLGRDRQELALKRKSAVFYHQLASLAARAPAATERWRASGPSALTRHSIYSGGSAVRELPNELADLGALLAWRLDAGRMDRPLLYFRLRLFLSVKSQSSLSLSLSNFHVEPGGGRPPLLLGLSSPLAISRASGEPLARTHARTRRRCRFVRP